MLRCSLSRIAQTQLFDNAIFKIDATIVDVAVSSIWQRSAVLSQIAGEYAVQSASRVHGGPGVYIGSPSFRNLNSKQRTDPQRHGNKQLVKNPRILIKTCYRRNDATAADLR